MEKIRILIYLLLPFILTFLISTSAHVSAQSINVALGSNDNRPTTQAHVIESTPLIDGNVLNDPAWQSVYAVSELWQTRPNPGLPASEKTEIRIAYDAGTIYIGVVCFDTKPEKLVVSDYRRDASLDDNDSFTAIFDTYNDGQNGFVFGTNSIGIEYDAQVDNEGQGNFLASRQQSGTIGGFNLNWDGSWKVKTEVGGYGWSAEFAIPFRTIRYNTGENQTWGVNFQRNIRKTNEIAYWSPIPIDFDIKRLSLAGKLTGLNLSSPGNLKVIPYVLGHVSRDYNSDDEAKITGDIGGDIKYSITPSMTLDLTYNTDFAQVEVDEQQVNLDRFNLFFPEKRPFFLENAGLFTVGSPGEIDLFFSRRIGIGSEGDLVPIIGGARLSGKINRTNVGLLSMFTDDVSEVGIEKNNYTVARVNHEFAKRSAIGGILVSRSGLGDLEDDYNRTFALDGKLGLGQKAQITGFLAKTSTPNIDNRDVAFQLKTEYEWNGWNFRLGYTEAREGFNPEVGFLQRQAFRKSEGLALYHWRMHGKFGLLELRPHVSYRGYWNFDGFQETGYLHIDNHWEWENGLEIHTGINFTTEGVVEDFEINDVTVHAGTYRHSEAQIVFMTNQSKKLSFSTRHVLGGAFGGKRYSNRGTLYFRAGDKFNSEFGLSHNAFRLPNGDFNTEIWKARLSYSFTPRIFTQALIQYINITDQWSANIRFGLLREANTGLFVVYNEGRELGGIQSRSFIIKYSHLIDVLK